MLRLTSLCALVATAATVAAQNPISLTTSADGSYSLTSGSWLSLVSGDTGVQINGLWISKASGGLQVLGTSILSNGVDAWGDYNSTRFDWATTGSTTAIYSTTFKVYSDVPAVIFEQNFPGAIIETGNTESAKDDVASSFPSFQAPASSALGWVQWAGAFIDRGSAGPSYGTWDAASLPKNFNSGVSGGPMVLFDESSTNACVVSTASDFMAGSVLSTSAGEFRSGILGSVASIPTWHTHETVIWVGAGPNAAMMAWGQGLLDRYGKSHDGSKFDYTNTNLGYNTDHGAYYYYTTANYSNYSTALSAVYNYSQTVGIPYKYVLLDSWWYSKGLGGGVANWTARPDIFTNGEAGMRALVEETNWRITAHNRYWSSDNVYAKQNGGDWDFYVDTKGSPAGGQMALPLQSEFWEWLLTDAVTKWGLTTYEQDWLYNEALGVDVLLTNITLGRQWLLQMGMGASAAGVTIQYCMPFPRHLLQSVEIPAVTQVRASDDHVPCEGYYPMQWRLGMSSMFTWAIGVAPFKDNAWSTSFQPGGSCGNSLEVSPALHLAISVFSAGPVTPADGVGYSDVNQILRTCTVGGKLLHPSRAMTALDAQVLGNVFTSNPAFTRGEIYSTYSYVSGWAWDHILAGDLNTSFTIYPANLVGVRADMPLRYGKGGVLGVSSSVPPLGGSVWGASSSDASTSIAYSLNTTTLDLTSLKVQGFDASTPITINACKETDFQVWHTAPVFANGWAVLGELSKWVPVAEARMESIAASATDVNILLRGEAGEIVPISFYNVASANVTTVTCTLGVDGAARVVMPYAVCQ